VVRLHSACTPANVLGKHLRDLQSLATVRHADDKVLVLLSNASYNNNDQFFLKIDAIIVTKRAYHMLWLTQMQYTLYHDTSLTAACVKSAACGHQIRALRDISVTVTAALTLRFATCSCHTRKAWASFQLRMRARHAPALAFTFFCSAAASCKAL